MHVEGQATGRHLRDPLTDEQSRLVNENLGLVGVHLRRHVHDLTRPRRDREWEDLFQEGCLGLIDAARRYRPERGIPFAAFALPRIHNAVRRALSTKFATVYVPPQRPTRKSVPRGGEPVPQDGEAVPQRGKSDLDTGLKPVPNSGRSDPRAGRNDADRHELTSIGKRRSAVASAGDPFSADNRRTIRDREPEIDNPQSTVRDRPSVRSLSETEELGLVSRRRSDPERPPGRTISSLLRDKYECALHAAADALAGQTSTRGDRDKLVRILTEERFLVPHDDARRPLRQIARDTHSSYARVAQCDQRLSGEIRRSLEADPEFRELQRRMRSDPLGGDVPVDERLEHELVLASTEEFVRRFRRADEPTRAGVLHSVLEVSHGDIEDLVRSRFVRLPGSARAKLLGKL